MLKGKALLVITRMEDVHLSDGGLHFDVSVFIQSCSSRNPEARDAVMQEFDLMEWELQPLPNQAYKLDVEDTLRASVVYEIHFPSYENREDGSELYLNKVRIRRIQRYKENNR